MPNRLEKNPPEYLRGGVTEDPPLVVAAGLAWSAAPPLTGLPPLAGDRRCVGLPAGSGLVKRTLNLCTVERLCYEQ